MIINENECRQLPKPKPRRRLSNISVNKNLDILYTSNHNNIPFGLGNGGFDQIHSQHNNDLGGIQSSRLLLSTKFNEKSQIIPSRDNFFLGKGNASVYNNYHQPGNMSMRQNHIMRSQLRRNNSKNNSHNISELKSFDMYNGDKSKFILFFKKKLEMQDHLQEKINLVRIQNQIKKFFQNHFWFQ